MPARKKVSDEALLSAYSRLGSVWAVGAEVGIGGQSVHERLVKLGACTPMNVFSAEEVDRLKYEYWIAAEAGKLNDLATDMGRTKYFICRKARELGLTNQRREKRYAAVWKYVSEEYAEPVWEEFKASSLGLIAYCKKKGYDDLGFSKCMKRYFADEWDHVIELKVAKQTKYRTGRAFEYRVRDDLRSVGFYAQRSPASKTPVDVTAIAPGVVILVQCKRHGALPPEEWNTLFDLAKSCGAAPVMAAMKACGRGIDYFLMNGRKDGSRRRQPMEPINPASMIRGAAETVVTIEQMGGDHA